MCQPQPYRTVPYRRAGLCQPWFIAVPLPQASSVNCGLPQYPCRRQRCVNHNPIALFLIAEQACVNCSPPQRPCRRQAASTVVHHSILTAGQRCVNYSPEAPPLVTRQAASTVAHHSSLTAWQRCVNHNPKAPPLAARQRCYRPLPMPLPSGQNSPIFPSAGRRPYQPSIPGVAGAVLWRNTSCALS